MLVEVDVDLDEVLEGCYAIVLTDEEHGCWVAHCPGEVPCICDTLKEATAVIREHLPKGRK